MTRQTQASSLPRTSLWRTVFALTATFVVIAVGTPAAQAQTFSVLHNFTGRTDGANPYAGVTVGPSGVLYGTASYGGTYTFGTVFKLRQINSTWVFSPLYEFGGGSSDGIGPEGGVVIGPNGALYGTTSGGGSADDGVVFELRPPATVCRSVLCYWNETLVHTFTGPPDGEYPGFGNLAFDQAGNIYGTTSYGGAHSGGTTFELTPSGGGWTESILHSFSNTPDGFAPFAGVVLDTAGNVYGTTGYGGSGTGCAVTCGTAYRLVSLAWGWGENILVNFGGEEGSYPFGTLIMDASGNLYGTTSGQNRGGIVFKLVPSGGGFTYSVLYTFTTCESDGGVAMDAAGNLFGVCQIGGAHFYGWIFELTNCSQGCSLVDLHDFSGSDGATPYGAPVLDANGNLYGTTFLGGATDNGVVWEIAGVGAPHNN